eukprot:TRINITY_DN14943_c0_g1_i1.p1 TRINITY_DN14943_c0_g1~~TRINITY_DN14943_c0_g1_i1.p1  ORF type:complete len:150 (+),score=26.59 TRINITY_DN14943_c0_g1_i1:67-516(+)
MCIRDSANIALKTADTVALSILPHIKTSANPTLTKINEPINTVEESTAKELFEKERENLIINKEQLMNDNEGIVALGRRNDNKAETIGVINVYGERSSTEKTNYKIMYAKMQTIVNISKATIDILRGKLKSVNIKYQNLCNAVLDSNNF